MRLRPDFILRGQQYSDFFHINFRYVLNLYVIFLHIETQQRSINELRVMNILFLFHNFLHNGVCFVKCAFMQHKMSARGWIWCCIQNTTNFRKWNNIRVRFCWPAKLITTTSLHECNCGHSSGNVFHQACHHWLS